MTVQERNFFPFFQKTRFTVLAQSLLSEPLTALFFGFTAVILYKSLHASPFQVTVYTILKPVVALFAFYWGASRLKCRNHLRRNVVLAGVLSRAPFLLFPWITSPWALIVCAAIYMVFWRAGVPDWIEVLRLNLSKGERAKIFSLSLSLAFLEGAIIGLWIGPLMDYDSMNWRWMFPLAAVIGMVSVYLQAKLPIDYEDPLEEKNYEKESFKERLIQPWVQAIKLLKQDADFMKFQIGFMVCGFGVMMVMPVLPIYYVDHLGISYTELALAILVCKGLGFVLSSHIWANRLNESHIFFFTCAVDLFFMIFPIFVILANFHVYWLYLAFFVYGIAQSGSRLSWNLSGPIFSKEKNSSEYSRLNILTVGIRGLIGPFLGGFLAVKLGATFVFIASSLLCLVAAIYMLRWAFQKKAVLFS